MCRIRTVVLASVLAGLLLLAVLPASAGLVGWQYQQEISIHENSGETLRDYQVLVELYGSDFPGEAQPDGDDIRFTDAYGRELSYWIEEFDAGSKRAKIWVKVPEIPANGEAGVTMWYGNSGVGSGSDGEAVFEFFDDFKSGSVSDRWSVTSGTFEASTDYAVSGTCAGKWSGGYSIHNGAFFDFGLRTTDFILEYSYRDGGAVEGAVFGSCYDISPSWGSSMLYDPLNWKERLTYRDASDTDYTIVYPFKDIWKPSK